MSLPDPNDDQIFTVVYDGEKGRVIVKDFMDAGISSAIEVRKSLVDQAVRQAAIIELERLGYTVLSPEVEEA